MDADDLIDNGASAKFKYSLGEVKYEKYRLENEIEELMGKKNTLQKLQSAWSQKKIVDNLDKILTGALDFDLTLEEKTAELVANGAPEDEIVRLWEEQYGNVTIDSRDFQVSGIQKETKKREREEEDSDVEFIQEWEQNLNSIFNLALQPLRTFGGAVVSHLGKFDARKVYVWQSDGKVVKPAKTIKEFIDLNRELGDMVLLQYLPAAKQQQPAPKKGIVLHNDSDEELDAPDEDEVDDMTEIYSTKHKLAFQLLGAPHNYFGIVHPNGLDRAADRTLEAARGRLGKRNFFYDAEIFKAIKKMRQNDPQMIFAPAWVYETMGNPVFFRLYSDGMMGAINIAFSQIRRLPNCREFTIKELICSPDVMDMFAFKVATTWMGSSGASSSGREGGGYQRNIYENVNETNRILSFKIEQCLAFFEFVYRVRNPLLDEFDRMAREKGIQDQQKIRDFKMLLPKYELVYRE